MLPITHLTQLPMAVIWFHRMWFAVPLIVVISLVYAATRHELIAPILSYAVRFALWVVGFMAIVFVVLAVITARL